MVGTGRLVTVGTAHVLLLLSCLDTSGCVSDRVATHDVLFYPSHFTWQESHFTLSSVNTSFILRFNETEQKFQALNWPQSVLRLPKGKPFSGYLYFRDKSPANAAVQVFPHSRQIPHNVILKDNKLDYCVAININHTMLKNVPGYQDENLVSPCIECHNSSCPDLKQHCSCGWVPIDINPTQSRIRNYRPFVGVEWWSVDDPKLNLIKKSQKSSVGRQIKYTESSGQTQSPKYEFQYPEPLKS